MNVCVRFAPSPTGHLHVGSVRVAIFNWLFARHHRGTYLLRIEDTDRERSKQEYVDSQLASLAWLGLMPDERALVQSTRQGEHVAIAHRLVKEGKAYRCFCDPKEYEGDESNRAKYDGTCRNKTVTEEELTQPHAIRFRLPRTDRTDGQLQFRDAIRGPISVSYDQLDDFIIVRRDGTPTYQLFVVLDDIYMGITHVIRGEDHISNTPKQILLYEAVGAFVPTFAHLPLILGPSGNRLSKRDAAVSVIEYKEQGYLPDALINYLVRLGWSHGDQEIFTLPELVEYFDLDHVGKKGAIFDIKKLQWLNGHYIRHKSAPELMKAISEKQHAQLHETWEKEKLPTLLELYKERSSTLVELVDSLLLLAQDPPQLDLSCIKKWRTPQLASVLALYEEKIREHSQLRHESLLAAANDVCVEQGIKLVQLAQPLRLALTGGIVSPGVFELIAVLGSETSLRRIAALRDALERDEQLPEDAAATPAA